MYHDEPSRLGNLLTPRELWLTIGLVTAAVLACFGTIVTHEFLLWDDNLLITQNSIVRGLSSYTVGRAFSSYDPELYIPLTFLSYQLNYAVAGLSPWIYFATNLGLHALNALLVGWILLLLTGRKSGALLGALLFAILPIQTEAVAWASARKDLLSACFFFGALVAWLRHRDSGRRYFLYWCLAFFVLALLSKVVAITLPIALLLLDLLEHRRIDRRMFMEKIPFFLLSILFGIIAIIGKRDVTSDTPLETFLLLPARSIISSLQHIVWPTGLSALYTYESPVTLANNDILLCWLAVIALVIATLWTLRTTRTVAFGVAFFLLTLAPTFTNVVKGQVVYDTSDRYVYLSLPGLLLIVAQWWGALYEKQNAARRSLLITAATLVVLSYGLVSCKQTTTWATSETLFTRALNVSPHSVAAYLNMGVDLRQKGKFTEAEAMIRKALSIRDMAKGHIALGALFMIEDRLSEAAAEFQTAMRLDPKDPQASYGLATALAKAGRIADAQAQYRQTLFLAPRDANVRNDLAALLQQNGDLDGARKEYELLVSIQPTFGVAQYNLGLIREQQGDHAGAIAAYEQALRYGGNQYLVLSHIGPLALRTGNVGEGVRAIRKALQIQSGDAAFLQDVLSSLRVVLEKDPRNETAQSLLQELLQRGLIKNR